VRASVVHVSVVHVSQNSAFGIGLGALFYTVIDGDSNARFKEFALNSISLAERSVIPSLARIGRPARSGQYLKPEAGQTALKPSLSERERCGHGTGQRTDQVWTKSYATSTSPTESDPEGSSSQQSLV